MKRPAPLGLVSLALITAVSLAGVAVAETVGTELLANEPERIVVRFTLGEHRSAPVNIDGEDFVQLDLPGEPISLEKGAPALPYVCRSVIIPDDAEMALRVVSERFYEVPTDVAPSKGNLPRTVNPADVPYTFGKAYETDAFYPGPLAELHDPYIMRDYRGVVATVYPFQYNPVTRILRVYTEMTVEITAVGAGQMNVFDRGVRARAPSRTFHEIYRAHFLNYNAGLRYDPLNEEGNMLIIAHDAWLDNVQPLAAHKDGIGIYTTVVGVSTIGNDPAAIKSYIQDFYDTPGSGLTFLLLVGDVAQVTSPTAVSGYDGASDPSYSKLAGSDDYPEIIVGRFSAESPADVDTQVERTIEYETMAATQQDWFWRGTGIASDGGPGDDGEMDYEHMDNLRDLLLGHGYTVVDQIYDPGASAAQVTAAINAGRGIVNYVGHGHAHDWVTTGFSNSDVNALTNDNMLPFVFSVACNNGEFDEYTCFAEAWLRATNAGEPTGAVAAYMSSISQPWDPPMEGQDEFNALYVNETYHSFGALCYAGSCSMMDDYPGNGDSWGTGPATFNTWHIFGDPSLRVVGTASPPQGMKVTPTIALSASGPAGGPFTPDSMVYTIENLNDTGLSYSVSSGQPWVSVSDESGHLDARATTDVTVSINSTADLLGNGSYSDVISFTNTTDHDGDTSRTVNLKVGLPGVVYSFPMNTDPGWSTEGEWAFGTPTGQGGADAGNPDPSSGATGVDVYGVNLNGDYSTSVGGPYYLTAGPLDLTEYQEVSLRFQRWLNSDYLPWVSATVEVSNDGTNWEPVFSNGTSQIADASWSLVSYDISATADNQATVFVRWGYAVQRSGAYSCSGWNIDDVEIWGLGESSRPGDFDGDNDVDGDDATQFSSCFTGPGGTLAPGCEPGDFDADGDIDCDDWVYFILAWTESSDPPDLAQCPMVTPLLPAWPHDAPKNRYVSFNPNNSRALTVAYQVELTDSMYFPDSLGVLGWVGEPDENGVARVVDEPFYSDTWPAVVHLGDCQIVPVASYDIHATVEGVPLAGTLEVSTIAQPGSKKWGDIVGDFTGTEWAAPDGEINMNDVMAAVQRFQQLDSAPPLTWVDVEGEVPNVVINMTDIIQIVHGFKSGEYPFSAPADCP